MSELNYRHLRYFWMVAKTGSIVQLRNSCALTPQSISGQLGEFESKLGVDLFRRAGRSLELTEAGRRILGMAGKYSPSVTSCWKSCTTTMPAVLCLSVWGLPTRCRNRWFIAWSNRQHGWAIPSASSATTLAISRLCHFDLAIHRLDMIIADRPMPANLNVRGFNHLLGESSIAVLPRKNMRTNSGRVFLQPSALAC